MKEGFFVAGSFFTFKYMAKKPSQYSVVAPKSMAKSAVLRNKLRRQGYNALSSLNIHKDIMGIFFYKKQAKMPIYKDIKDDIGLILSKIK